MLEERVARIESDVEHIKGDISDLKIDQREIRQDLKGLREDFNSFKVDVTRQFGAVLTAIESGKTATERSKRWMIVAGAALLTTAISTLASLGRIMKWF